MDNPDTWPRSVQAASVRAIPAIAWQQCGVFSTAQALQAGWTKSALRHATSRGFLKRLRAGAYQVADLAAMRSDLSEFELARWRHAGPGVAAALTSWSAVASHSTAAVLRGIPLLFLPGLACVSVAPWWTGRMAAVHLHRCTAPPLPYPTAGVECTSTERIVIDLGREHGVAAAVVAADYVLHTGMSSPAMLDGELDRCRRWPGVRSAREAIAFADARTESVLETRSRIAFRKWGLPAPEPQVRIGNEWGRFVARVDFYWPQFGVVGEADGDVKYGGTDPEPLLHEKKRQRRLEDLDLPVVRWGSEDIQDFAPVSARLRRTFARAARMPREDRRWTVLPPL